MLFTDGHQTMYWAGYIRQGVDSYYQMLETCDTKIQQSGNSDAPL